MLQPVQWRIQRIDTFIDEEYWNELGNEYKSVFFTKED